MTASQSELGDNLQLLPALLWEQILANPHTLKEEPDEPSAVHRVDGNRG